MKLIKIILGTVLVSCVAFNTFAQESRLKKILSEGELRVGTTGDWNPMTMKNPASDSYTGFDIDMMNELAKDMGVKVTFVPTDWKTLVNGVLADKYDLTGSASISVGRAKVAGYSNAYFELGTVPLVLKKNLSKFQSWGDLNKEGITVAATLGTTQEQQVKNFFPKANKKIIEAPARDFQEVLAGRADAHITSNVEAEKLVEKYSQLAIVPVRAMKARTPIAMLMDQNDHTWINFINHWIRLKTARGFFDQLATKWKLATP
ncbi:MAG: transporter substrate-binding domain-containing protein [SAR324 cluster bacterium]|nr:transporter substrate-binding domain-containing protein [SAR324 cluster bacterium]